MTGSVADIDTAKLESSLVEEFGIEITGAEVLHDGLNLTVALSTKGDERAYVLRRPNKLRHTGYMSDLGTEYGVIKRLHDTPPPTPAPVLFCDDESVLGEPFFVTSYLDGETVPNGSLLPERFRNSASRERAATLLVDTLAETHSLDPEPFGEICEQRTPLEQVENAVDRLDETERVMGRKRPRLRRVADWLRRNPPLESEMGLIHGDFRPSNVLFGGTNTPEITGVLDWEAAMVGDPLTELGYLLLHWHSDSSANLDELESNPSEATMRDLHETNETGLCPFTAKSGSPSRRELVARYEGQTGRQFENGRFYCAHAAFVLAMVWEDLDRHAVEAGGEVEPAPSVDYMALVAEQIVDGEFRV